MPEASGDLPPTGGDPFWTAERFAEWNDYADRADVVIQFGSLMGSQVGSEYWFIAPETQAEWSREWLQRCLLELATADEASCCGHGNYVLESKDSKVEWGASGASYELTLTLAEALLGGAAYESLRWIAKEMATKVKARWGDPQGDVDLTEESATSCALRAVQLRLAHGPSRQAANLACTSVRLDSEDQAVVEIRDLEGATEYEVVIEQVGGYITLGKVRTVRYEVRPGGSARSTGSDDEK